MMSKRQKKKITKIIFNDLMKLTSDTEVFYFQDTQINSEYKYRIFDYRISVYSNFLLKRAKEARGIMFLMKGDSVLDIVSRPMQKFFNYKENPETNFNCSVKNIKSIVSKEDGSLISTYLDLDKSVKLKSKGAIASDQANDANAFYEQLDDINLKSDIFYLVTNDYTVNMEWTAPFNCVVLRYEKPQLTVLNVRHNYTGEYLSEKELLKFNGLKNYLVKCNPEINLDNFTDMIDLYFYIRNLTHIEGYIIKFKNTWVKVKTDWYCNLHTSKFSISSDKQLFFAFLEERLDDLKQIVDNDPYFTERIFFAEKIFSSRCNHIIKEIHDAYNNHKHITNPRDFYAAISNLDTDIPYLVGICMAMFRGRGYMPELKRQFRLNYQTFLREFDEEVKKSINL